MLLRLRPASSGRFILRPATRKEYRPARIATTGYESVCCETHLATRTSVFGRPKAANWAL
jgi:hypothetical protein